MLGDVTTCHPDAGEMSSLGGTQLLLDLERLPPWLGGDITFQNVTLAFYFPCKDLFRTRVGQSGNALTKQLAL